MIRHDERRTILKKFTFFLLCILMIVPTIVSAHTSLSSSNPTEGQVVTEDLEQITLNFATSIEELSTMKLVKDGNEISLEEVMAENKQLIGTVSEPLKNGTYTVQWNIFGEDGHPIKGEINFTIQMEQIESEPNPTSPEQENVKKEDGSQDKQIEQNNANDDSDNTTDQKSPSTNLLISIFIGLLAIFGIGFLWFLIKKR